MNDKESDGDANENRKEQFKLKKKLGLQGSIALIAGTMVGSGIFASPVGVLVGTNGSVGMSLVLWAACGVIAGLASLCYCELASMFQDSGGGYAYLYRGYGRAGPILAFTFAWTSVVVTRSSSNAATAVTFGSYVVAPFFQGSCIAPDVIGKVSKLDGGYPGPQREILSGGTKTENLQFCSAGLCSDIPPKSPFRRPWLYITQKSL